MKLFDALVNYGIIHGQPADIEIFSDGRWTLTNQRGLTLNGNGETALVAELTEPLEPADLATRLSGTDRESAIDLIVSTMRGLGYDAAMDVFEGLA